MSVSAVAEANTSGVFIEFAGMDNPEEDLTIVYPPDWIEADPDEADEVCDVRLLVRQGTSRGAVLRILSEMVALVESNDWEQLTHNPRYLWDIPAVVLGNP